MSVIYESARQVVHAADTAQVSDLVQIDWSLRCAPALCDIVRHEQQETLRRMIAVTHSAATSPRSMTSLTAASLASHGARASIGSHAGLGIAAHPQSGAEAAHRRPQVAHAATAPIEHSPMVRAAGSALGSMAWAAATPGISIAAAAQAALAAAATPAQPLGLAFSDSDDDSSDDSGLDDDDDDSDAGAADEVMLGISNHVQHALSSSWHAEHEPHPPAAETDDGDAVDAAKPTHTVLSAAGVTIAADRPAFGPGNGGSPSQPELVQVHAGQPADSEPSGGEPTLSGSAVQWVAADVAAQSGHSPSNQQSGSGGGATASMSDMRSEAGPDEALAIASALQADLGSVQTPVAEADTLTPVLSRPSRIPRPPSATPSSVLIIGGDSDRMEALRRSATAATSRAVAYKEGCDEHSEGGAHGDAAGHKDAVYALEGASVEGLQDGDYSIAAVFSELALVAKLEAASSKVTAEQPEGDSRSAPLRTHGAAWLCS